MFNGGKGGKTPLVAATYYFNSELGDLRHHREALYSDTPSSSSSSSSSLASPLSNNEPDENPIVNEDVCQAADGRKGSCYDAQECVNKGGVPMGRCANAKRDGIVCCLFELSCGQMASEKFVYFRNPGFPQSYQSSKVCRARIGKMDKNVCFYRVDMLTFDLAPPNRGNCSQDVFVVSGQNENSIVPKICGLNSGQHYYLNVDESDTVSLHALMLGTRRRKFDILITQIPCHSENAAPSHCLQYYTGTHGSIKSFNYDSSTLNMAFEGYPNDIDYVACIKKESGFCSISYELYTDGEKISPFAIGSNYDSGYSLWRPIIAECPDDYLSIGGVRLCSGKLITRTPTLTISTNETTVTDIWRPSSMVLNATIDHPTIITDNTSGPFTVRFVSNHINNARGFHLRYKQNPCK
ncbi:uncharacterized protein LOC107360300 [Tetranychus urticae]|nr:uncharacterized protein LOC107360300 [Tetranychus urticae]